MSSTLKKIPRWNRGGRGICENPPVTGGMRAVGWNLLWPLFGWEYLSGYEITAFCKSTFFSIRGAGYQCTSAGNLPEKYVWSAAGGISDPEAFPWKGRDNPVLLTDAEGNKLETSARRISAHEWNKYQEILKNHTCAPRSKIYLADGYDIVRRYTNNLEIEEDFVNPKRGILILYALPDTAALGMSEAQAYAIIWDAFHRFKMRTFRNGLLWTGNRSEEWTQIRWDRCSSAVSQFEKKILHHLTEIDGIVLAGREALMRKAGKDSLELWVQDQVFQLSGSAA